MRKTTFTKWAATITAAFWGENLDRGKGFHIPDYYVGINEEDFMKLYRRSLG